MFLEQFANLQLSELCQNLFSNFFMTDFSVKSENTVLDVLLFSFFDCQGIKGMHEYVL